MSEQNVLSGGDSSTGVELESYRASHSTSSSGCLAGFARYSGGKQTRVIGPLRKPCGTFSKALLEDAVGGILQHFAAFLTAKELSRVSQVSRVLRAVLGREAVWAALNEKYEFRSENKTRTRNNKPARTVYLESICAECHEPGEDGRFVFNLPGCSGSFRKQRPLCYDCCASVKAFDSVSERKSKKVLPRLQARGEAEWIQLLDVIPTSKDLKKTKKLKDGIESPFHQDSLFNLVKVPQKKTKKTKTVSIALPH